MSRDNNKMPRVELERLAEAGDPEAQYELSRRNRDSPFEEDRAFARELLTLAAEQGHTSAQSDLGVMLLEGLGGPEDAQAAITWFERAAEQGVAQAEFNRGRMYLQGIGSDKDFALARSWLSRAAAKGYAQAQNDLGSILLNGMGVPKDEEGAVALYEKAAEQGLATAQFNLALRYIHGSGVVQDPAKAIPWLWRAMEQRHAEATCELGTMYRFGTGVEQNRKAAAQLHLQAAKWGDPVAYGNLSDGHEEIADIALNGDVQAALVMAQIHAGGFGVDKDPVDALAWCLILGTEKFPFHDEDAEAEAEHKLHEQLLAALRLLLGAMDQQAASLRCRELEERMPAILPPHVPNPPRCVVGNIIEAPDSDYRGFILSVSNPTGEWNR